MYYSHRSRKEKNETTEKRGEVGSMRPPPQDLFFRFGRRYTCPLHGQRSKRGLLRKKGPLALQLFQTSGVRFPVREDLKHMHLSESTLRRTGGPSNTWHWPVGGELTDYVLLTRTAEGCDDTGAQRVVGGRIASSEPGQVNGAYAETRSQKARRRCTLFSGALPAISAEVMAPMETPTTQLGDRCASTNPSNTPA